ncbi:hypothetical protein CCACVL1_09147 [Corchorus capsularis]|uniref:Uncharacterized protein n=1 Tax=Corchorus capsularis TaxID=210143 RepID=A0A1R3IXH6_COCAP|nr:hypothetical protein CCACVL1_09147 [Corchorus capsularis]
MAPNSTPRRRCYRQRDVETEELPDCSHIVSSDSIGGGHNHKEENNGLQQSGFSTPKGKKFRIPEMLSCPGAPMKPRVGPKLMSRRSSAITFFSSPEIELFFFLAFHHVSA